MTDIANVSNGFGMIDPFPDEKEFYEKVEALCGRAKKAIENKAFDRAIDILLVLDKEKCLGQASSHQKFEIVTQLCHQGRGVIDNLMSKTFNTFSLIVKEGQVVFKEKDGATWNAFPLLGCE